jgi:predicted nucleic-acid-binding Zn-ribbon protein
MRLTQTCPKCKSDDVVHIPQIADRDDGDVVRPLMLYVKHSSWKEDTEIGRVEAYVCRHCGFTELYTAGAAQLPLDRIPGSRVLKK